MRNCPISLIVAVTGLIFVALSPVMFAQATYPLSASKDQTARQLSFNPHDLTGIWVRGKVPKGNAPLSGDRPPFTPWGQAKFNAVRGSFAYSRAPGIAPPIAPENEWN